MGKILPIFYLRFNETHFRYAQVIGLKTMQFAGLDIAKLWCLFQFFLRYKAQKCQVFPNLPKISSVYLMIYLMIATLDRLI